jgi:hypothetical protein
VLKDPEGDDEIGENVHGVEPRFLGGVTQAREGGLQDVSGTAEVYQLQTSAGLQRPRFHVLGGVLDDGDPAQGAEGEPPSVVWAPQS